MGEEEGEEGGEDDHHHGGKGEGIGAEEGERPEEEGAHPSPRASFSLLPFSFCLLGGGGSVGGDGGKEAEEEAGEGLEPHLHV